MEIVTAIIILAVIGIAAGVLLSVASILFAVKKDEKAEQIEAVLAGANCGACGYSGCAGYAAALSSGKETNTALCSPGGADTAKDIADVLGVASGEFVKKTAVVRCRGSWDVEQMKAEYRGIQTCAAANQLFKGFGACEFGCIGFGDCMAKCSHDAIHIENGVAIVDADSCGACGECAAACPKGLIAIVPSQYKDRTVLCRNKNKGAVTRKLCSVGCIGCMKCEKACETGAITVKDFLASVDYEKCTGCGKCVEVCPQHCIDYYHIKCAEKNCTKAD